MDTTPTPPDQGKLNKAVTALAIEPLTMAFTANGRKAYNVMLWMSQRSSPDSDGGYSSPVTSIVRGFDPKSRNQGRIRRYIEQMTQTTVLWRDLSRPPPQHGLFDSGEEVEPSQELRIFPLLSEARIYTRNNQEWVTWFYPPTIRDQLLSPEQWANLRLSSISKLSTYTAIALYEICARYKNNPGNLTSRHPPEFWVAVLREGGPGKLREYRKFKNEVLLRAILDVNANTEITVELIEHRRGASIAWVQFRVVKKTEAPAGAPAQPVDVTLAFRAAAVGIAERDLDAMLERFSPKQVEQALLTIEQQLSNPLAPPILHRAGYLRRLLVDAHPTPPSAQPGEAAQMLAQRQALDAAAKALDERRFRDLSQSFAALDEATRTEFIAGYLHSQKDRLLAPAVKRLQRGEWESPLVRRGLLQAWAESRAK